MSANSTPILEKAVTFGDSSLVGIMSQPAGGVTSNNTGLIIMNSGILHRAGAGRLHVKIARAMAAQGFTCLRFDHAGIGDSGARRGSSTFEESALVEVGQAIDYLEKRAQLKSFVLFGLCSGADVSFEYGIDDPRVVGIAQLDPWFYPTTKSRVNMLWKMYLPKLFSPLAWQRQWGKITALWSSADEDRDEWYSDPDYIRVTPPRDALVVGLNKLVKREAKILAIFSGGQQKDYNYQAQFQESFPEVDFRSCLEVHFAPEATHLFTALKDQQYVIDTMVAWHKNAFPSTLPDDEPTGELPPIAAGQSV